MAWTYSGDPTASVRDRVRFLIGDTDSSAPEMTDAEIDAMIEAAGNEPYAAAVSCAYALAAKYARKVDKSIGDLSISWGKVAQGYRELVQQLRVQAAGAAGVLAPYAGGLSKSDKEGDQEDSDMVQPNFRIDLHDTLPDTHESSLEE
jgi:hypothetical protein